MQFKAYIPNLLTLINLFAGCVVVVSVVSGDTDHVWLLITISLVADLLDGMMARALNAFSEIGKELDSLADMVSFGLSPAVMLWSLGQTIHPEEMPYTLLYIWPYLAFILSCCTALRLAKFNTLEDTAGDFIGLPSPAAAMMVFGVFLATNANPVDHYYSWIGWLGLLLITSILMVSNIPLLSLKVKNLSWKDNKYRYLILVIGAGCILMFKFYGITLSVIMYICISIIYNSLNKSKDEVHR